MLATGQGRLQLAEPRLAAQNDLRRRCHGEWAQGGGFDLAVQKKGRCPRRRGWGVQAVPHTHAQELMPALMMHDIVDTSALSIVRVVLWRVPIHFRGE